MDDRRAAAEGPGAAEEPLWLVIDDLHELGSAEALRQLELLVMRAPQQLRLVLATRHDLRLGLHRLRLEGELTEIRAEDLRFSLRGAGAVRRGRGGAGRAGAGDAARADRGWVAGLRMAALSLAGHPDPERFAAEFSGTERTVAEYLLAEVLARQPEQVRRLLLADQRAGTRQRRAGRPAHRRFGWRAAAAGSGGGQRVRGVAGRGAVLVPVPPPVRRPAAAGAASHSSRRRSPRCTSGRPGGWPATVTRSRRSGTPRPRGTGGWPPGCWPTTGRAFT